MVATYRSVRRFVAPRCGPLSLPLAVAPRFGVVPPWGRVRRTLVLAPQGSFPLRDPPPEQFALYRAPPHDPVPSRCSRAVPIGVGRVGTFSVRGSGRSHPARRLRRTP